MNTGLKLRFFIFSLSLLATSEMSFAKEDSKQENEIQKQCREIFEEKLGEMQKLSKNALEVNQNPKLKVHSSHLEIYEKLKKEVDLFSNDPDAIKALANADDLYKKLIIPNIDRDLRSDIENRILEKVRVSLEKVIKKYKFESSAFTRAPSCNFSFSEKIGISCHFYSYANIPPNIPVETTARLYANSIYVIKSQANYRYTEPSVEEKIVNIIYSKHSTGTGEKVERYVASKLDPSQIVLDNGEGDYINCSSELSKCAAQIEGCGNIPAFHKAIADNKQKLESLGFKVLYSGPQNEQTPKITYKAE